MRALEKRLGLSGLNYRAEEKVKHFKERIANVKSCVDSNAPRSLVEKEAKGGLSPSKKHVTAKERADLIALDNMLLAKRIFKIMDSPAPISSVINDTRHLNVGHTSMNFRSRLEETQRIHKRNLEFATRLEKVEPVYGYDDLHANRGMLAGRHKDNKKKTRRRKKDTDDDTENDGFLTARSDAATLSPRGDFGSPRSAPGGSNKRILYETILKKEYIEIYTIVAKDQNSDQYSILGYSKEEQRYEVRLTSEDISNIIDGDILVTSVERKEVWEALIPKVELTEVAQFGKFSGLNPEEYLKRKVASSQSKSPAKPSGSAPSNRGGRAGKGVRKAKTAKELREEEELHAAATKLQSLHRAKVAKKKVDFHREMKKAADEIGDSDEAHEAAAKLQALHRVKVAKKHVAKKKEEEREQHQAAAKLQAIHRGKLAKKEVEKKKEEKEQHQAAAKLQAIHRGKSAKKEVEKKKQMMKISQEIGDSPEVHNAATKLQAVHRRRSANKEVEEKKREAETAKAIAAPTERKPRPPSSGAPSKKNPYGNSRPSSKGSRPRPSSKSERQ